MRLSLPSASCADEVLLSWEEVKDGDQGSFRLTSGSSADSSQAPILCECVISVSTRIMQEHWDCNSVMSEPMFDRVV